MFGIMDKPKNAGLGFQPLTGDQCGCVRRNMRSDEVDKLKSIVSSHPTNPDRC